MSFEGDNDDSEMSIGAGTCACAVSPNLSSSLHETILLDSSLKTVDDTPDLSKRRIATAAAASDTTNDLDGETIDGVEEAKGNRQRERQ